jgi:integrase
MRTRTQKGEVYAKGPMWYLRFYDWKVEDGQLQRKRLCRQLGSKDNLTRKQAEREAEQFLAGINKPVLPAHSAVQFNEYVETFYLPRLKRDMRPSTYRGYCTVWTALKPFTGALWIRDMVPADVETILGNMADTGRFNKHTIQHVKFFLSGAFRVAIVNNYYRGANPVKPVQLPKNVREPEETYAYSLEEVLGMIAAVPEPASTMIASIAFTGVRKGEMRGFCWENYRDGRLQVKQSIWGGISTDPKSKKSKRAIPIIQHLAARFSALRAGQGNPISGPIFPNGRNKAVCPDSVLNRIILPALSKQGIEWHGWHAFRRGAATNLNRLGVDDWTIAEILGHEDVEVTRKCYIKADNEQAKVAMGKFQAKLEELLIATQWTPIDKVTPIKGVM